MAGKQFQPFRTELSINDIRASAWNASQGSLESYQKLQKENARLAKIANSRMRALEKSGLDMNAYNRARTFLDEIGVKRFSTVLPDQGNYKAIVKQLEELVTFVNSKTSTVAGARTALNAKLDKLQEATGHTYTEDQRLRLGKLLGNDSISSLLREVKGDSQDVIEVLEEVSMDEYNKDEIVSIIDRHLAGYNPFEDNPFFANFDYLNYDQMMKELLKLKPKRS
jgi:hypothetical protein